MHPHSMMLPPPCFTVGMVYLGSCAIFVFRQTHSYSYEGLKEHISSNHFFPRLLCPLHLFVSNFNGTSYVFILPMTSFYLFYLGLKARFVECTTNCYTVNGFAHWSCGSAFPPLLPWVTVFTALIVQCISSGRLSCVRKFACGAWAMLLMAYASQECLMSNVGRRVGLVPGQYPFLLASLGLFHKIRLSSGHFGGLGCGAFLPL
ncbi:hypothetical protein XENOCAPTIV_014844 [Xenoophorus captivus]|uniref:Uncharacterized protein n=1 Tax=Xenoophorus captivus TaxID=1517983 RepID=A0ABV0QAZ6_9TELE